MALVDTTVALCRVSTRRLNIDELVGEQIVIGVGKLRAQIERAGGRVDLAVEGLQFAGGELNRTAAVQGSHWQLRAIAQALHDLREVVLGHREDDRDGFDLGDDDEAGRGLRRYVVAWVDEAQADDSVDRGRDMAVRDIELLGIDLGLVRDHVSSILEHQRDLGIELLAPRNRVGLHQVLVALEVKLGGLQQRPMVALERTLRLGQGKLIGAQIDLGQGIARFLTVWPSV